MKTIKLMFVALVSMLIVSCGTSTKTTSSWKSPDVTSNYLSGKKIMVVALLPDKDRDLQKQMESNLVEELSSKGISAVSGFDSFGPKYLPDNEEKALSKLQESGADEVLTIVLLDKDKQRNYNPGYVSVRPVGYYRNWYGYYRTIYSRVYTPGYYTSNTTLMWESNLYDLKSNKLLYSTQSQSFDPSSVSSLASGYSKILVNDMIKQSLIAASATN